MTRGPGTRPDLAEKNRARFNPDAVFRVHASEYAIWRGMNARCHNEKAKDFKNYGARGVCVCARWRESFEAFFADIGRRPSAEHQIDRTDNNGNYEPGNCAWRTPSDNARNRRTNKLITCFGETLPLVEWASRTGISRVLIAYRIKSGWEPEKALTAPPSRSANYRHARKRCA